MEDKISEVYFFTTSLGNIWKKGYLESRAISIGEHKISRSLQRVAPNDYRNHSHNTTSRTNLSPYFARCFGHKIHLDQNEKLACDVRCHTCRWIFRQNH